MALRRFPFDRKSALVLLAGFLFLGFHVSLAHASVYVSNVTGLYHFDNDVTDSSGNHYDFTATGGAFATDTPSGKTGYSWDSINTDDLSNTLAYYRLSPTGTWLYDLATGSSTLMQTIP